MRPDKVCTIFQTDNNDNNGHSNNSNNNNDDHYAWINFTSQIATILLTSSFKRRRKLTFFSKTYKKSYFVKMRKFLILVLCLYLTNSVRAGCMDSDFSTHPDGFAKSGDSGNYYDSCMRAIRGLNSIFNCYRSKRLDHWQMKQYCFGFVKWISFF